MLLGELLVYRYQLITKEQRAAALESQRGAERGRRLGDVLMQMGLITPSQLEEVLDYQLQERDPWRGAW